MRDKKLPKRPVVGTIRWFQVKKQGAGSHRSLVPLVCASLTLALGLLTFIGWISALPLLASLRVNYIPMSPSTALCFSLLGIGIIIQIARPNLRWIPGGLATVVLVIACAKLMEFLGVISFGIDTWFVRTPGKLGLGSTGRMAPVTATNFLFTAAGLLALAADRFRKSAATFGALVTVIATVVLVGFWYGTPLFYGGALLSASAFFLCGIAIITVAGSGQWPAVLSVVLAVTVVLALQFSKESATTLRHRAVPYELEVPAYVVGFPDEVRYFPRDPGDLKLMTKEFVDSWEREKVYLHRQDLPPTSYLAISGGGDNGAFTAGFLNGWTKAGTRPQFKLVTGVSTGALIAPFAFLGPDYDETLRSIYTNVSRKDILTDRIFYSVLLQDAMEDTTPLGKLLEAKLTQKMVDAIGAEYAKGRLLFLATTNLDAKRPVVWNITKIAASGQPGALDLIRKIMLASAAIPGAFPPVMFDVEANGKTYQEMHVDGSASAQVFAYWTGVEIKKLSEEHGAQRERTVYVLCNARLDPQWAEVERRTLSITLNAIDTLIEYHVIGDLYRIYEVTKRDGTDFNLAYIPETFRVRHTEQFDPAYMRQLYEFGFAQATAGYRWRKQPPSMVGDYEKDASP